MQAIRGNSGRGEGSLRVGYSRSASMRVIRPSCPTTILRIPISWPKSPVKSTRTSALELSSSSIASSLVLVL